MWSGKLPKTENTFACALAKSGYVTNFSISFGLSLPLSLSLSLNLFLCLPILRLLVSSWRTQHQLQHRAENVVLHLQWQLKCHSPWLMELTIAPRSPGYSLLTTFLSLSLFSSPYPLSTQNAARLSSSPVNSSPRSAYVRMYVYHVGRYLFCCQYSICTFVWQRQLN